MAKTTETTKIGTSEINAGHLRAFVERIERLEEEKKALSGDIRDVYGEAKANGFDVKIMRKIVSSGNRTATAGSRRRRFSICTSTRSA